MEALFPFLERFGAAETQADRATIESELFDRFGRSGAVLISDMAGFSRITKAKGIVHYMNMIRRMRLAFASEVTKSGGQVIKFVADNAYATFDSVEVAARTLDGVQRRLDVENRQLEPDSHVMLGAGIEYGAYLALAGEDFFGDPVNIASKLGEDLATGRELWLSENAYDRLSEAFKATWRHSWHMERHQVSGLRLKTFKTHIGDSLMPREI
ncbi:MAG: adenylate/guanylate cyclase domain-containing protein [Rhodospirillales bacterium]